MVICELSREPENRKILPVMVISYLFKTCRSQAYIFSFTPFSLWLKLILSLSPEKALWHINFNIFIFSFSFFFLYSFQINVKEYTKLFCIIKGKCHVAVSLIKGQHVVYAHYNGSVEL